MKCTPHIFILCIAVATSPLFPAHESSKVKKSKSFTALLRSKYKELVESTAFQAVAALGILGIGYLIYHTQFKNKPLEAGTTAPLPASHTGDTLDTSHEKDSQQPHILAAGIGLATVAAGAATLVINPNTSTPESTQTESPASPKPSKTETLTSSRSPQGSSTLNDRRVAPPSPKSKASDSSAASASSSASSSKTSPSQAATTDATRYVYQQQTEGINVTYESHIHDKPTGAQQSIQGLLDPDHPEINKTYTYHLAPRLSIDVTVHHATSLKGLSQKAAFIFELTRHLMSQYQGQGQQTAVYNYLQSTCTIFHDNLITEDDISAVYRRICPKEQRSFLEISNFFDLRNRKLNGELLRIAYKNSAGSRVAENITTVLFTTMSQFFAELERINNQIVPNASSSAEGPMGLPATL